MATKLCNHEIEEIQVSQKATSIIKKSHDSFVTHIRLNTDSFFMSFIKYQALQKLTKSFKISKIALEVSAMIVPIVDA